MSEPRVPDPILRDWQINATHSRYDIARSAPSEDVLKIQFSILAGINLIVAVACFILLVAILRSRNVRKQPFNLYLLFIVIPDFVAAASCFITCVLSAPAGAYFSEAMCGWQSWYLVFGFTANCWMNGVIVHQIYRMLQCSHRRMHYTPPTQAYVIRQAACVYLYAAALAFLGTWNWDWSLHQTSLLSGFACFPQEYDFASSFVYWLFFMPAFMILPTIYAIWVTYDVVIRRKMMPPVGRRRSLVLYFARLIFIYLFMWFPFVLVGTLAMMFNWNSWVHLSAAAWSHLQGIVSVGLSVTKEDVYEAVEALLQCREERSVVVGASTRSLSQGGSLSRSLRRMFGSSSRLPSNKGVDGSKPQEESKKEQFSGHTITVLGDALESADSHGNSVNHEEAESTANVMPTEDIEAANSHADGFNHDTKKAGPTANVEPPIEDTLSN